MYFDEINTNISMYSIYLGCGMCNMCNNLIMHCMYLNSTYIKFLCETEKVL